MDRIAIEGIEVHAHHGVLADERRHGQRFLLDLVLELDLAPAVASDDLADTVDYGHLAQRAADVATGGPHDLLEALAGRVLDACLEDPRVAAAEVTVHKPEAPLPVQARDVAVTLRRARSAP